VGSPRLFVVTGGPCSGKTTLIRALDARGFVTVREAAIDVIEGLNRRMGVEGQRRWRRRNLLEFQRMILELQIERERAVADLAGVVFLDRGIADGVAYLASAGIEPPAGFLERARRSAYERVLLLETLGEFRDRSGTGRLSTRDDSVRIAGLIGRVYASLGVPVTHVADVPVAERVERVLEVALRSARSG
jgi:predicted ATPase